MISNAQDSGDYDPCHPREPGSGAAGPRRTLNWARQVLRRLVQRQQVPSRDFAVTEREVRELIPECEYRVLKQSTEVDGRGAVGARCAHMITSSGYVRVSANNLRSR